MKNIKRFESFVNEQMTESGKFKVGDEVQYWNLYNGLTKVKITKIQDGRLYYKSPKGNEAELDTKSVTLSSEEPPKNPWPKDQWDAAEPMRNGQKTTNQKIYTLPGDPYEYKVMEDNWLARKKGTDKWFSITGKDFKEVYLKSIKILDDKFPKARTDKAPKRDTKVLEKSKEVGEKNKILMWLHLVDQHLS
jgi:hypothetical protein